MRVYLIQFEPHKGAGIVDNIENLDMAGFVVVDLIAELSEHSIIELYCDNVFISATLIDCLSHKIINITCTDPFNRTYGCPLTYMKSFKKLKFAAFEFKFMRNRIM